MNKLEIEKLFYIEKNYSKIKETLKTSSDSWSFNLLAKIALYECNLDLAFEYFNKAQNIYGCAYTKFLAGDLLEAKVLLCLIKDHSPAVQWTYNLIELLNKNTNVFTTYFQIRNFYEQDLEMLFLYNQRELAEKIINLNQYFENFNREVYKYTARVLYNNQEYKFAEIFIKKSLDISYNDPETHFILGELFEKSGYTKAAIGEFKKADEVNNGYLPAEKKLIELNK